ncbi:hypothetical protein ACFSF0_04390 [Ottowia flava]|uniref:Uncharacterized protein n=1 Tax=Ottowia flava TaxID=2675430 RepID=A0ABW4KNZ9_9BURK|nr:hypothetical protein [Ottowia sp. GY511]
MNEWIEWKEPFCPVFGTAMLEIRVQDGATFTALARDVRWDTARAVAYRHAVGLHPTQAVVQNPDSLQPFAIVAIVSPVDGRRYSLAEEAKQEALRLSEEKGYSYTVVQVLGEAKCHKSSEWVGG